MSLHRHEALNVSLEFGTLFMTNITNQTDRSLLFDGSQSIPTGRSEQRESVRGEQKSTICESIIARSFRCFPVVVFIACSVSFSLGCINRYSRTVDPYTRFRPAHISHFEQSCAHFFNIQPTSFHCIFQSGPHTTSMSTNLVLST